MILSLTSRKFSKIISSEKCEELKIIPFYKVNGQKYALNSLKAYKFTNYIVWGSLRYFTLKLNCIFLVIILVFLLETYSFIFVNLETSPDVSNSITWHPQILKNLIYLHYFKVFCNIWNLFQTITLKYSFRKKRT